MQYESIGTPHLNDSASAHFTDDNVTNATGLDYEVKHPALGVVLALFSFVTICGNVLVIVAVAKEIYLRTVTNYFIVSLAVADVMVGGLVMPFSISHEMTHGIWLYGEAWCDLWHSFDVLASTASILNLCMISLDRYWAITDPINYPTRMSAFRVSLLIAFVWLCSAGISFPAIAWWRSVTPMDLSGNDCVFTEDSAYLIISSLVSFYFPTLVMMVVYFQIYRAAVSQSKSLASGSKVLTSNGVNGQEVMTLRIHRGGMNKRYNREDMQQERSSDSDGDSPLHSTRSRSNSQADEEHVRPGKFLTARLRKFAISKKLTKFAKEQKAAKTLGIVVGIFIVCWLPFFIANMLFGICKAKCIPYSETVFPIFTWLGYINSCMNPVIYALSLRDFRRAFGKILCSCCPNYNPRHKARKFICSTSNSSFSAACHERCSGLRL